MYVLNFVSVLSHKSSYEFDSLKEHVKALLDDNVEIVLAVQRLGETSKMAKLLLLLKDGSKNFETSALQSKDFEKIQQLMLPWSSVFDMLLKKLSCL
mmetsp:Transcript_3446/g.6377  ORF Transcript_3446/g.6377 Transcript_3446/m.6377 type:complete len:97 (+) Transcript_3446:613-903(+)